MGSAKKVRYKMLDL